MSLTALNVYWSHTRTFVESNWKYGAFFICGSLISAVCTFSCIKHITGQKITQLLFNIFLKKAEAKYRNVMDYNGFSIWFGIRPSTELIAFDSIFRSMNTKTKQNEKSMTRQEMINEVTSRRKQVKIFVNALIGELPSFVPNPEKIVIHKNINNNVLNGYLLKYPGTTLDNGLIIYIHGGGAHCGVPAMGYPMLCIMQQYLGCYSLGIDYQLCPEISLLQQIDECIEAYKYVLNVMKVDNNKIFIVGESYGCCLCLLFLQKLNKLNLPQPCGGIMFSSDVDLTCKLALKTETDDGIDDAMADSRIERQLYTLCIDENDKKEFNDYDTILSLDKYNPLNGNWKGLCPLYIHASLNEVLIGNSKAIVDKCKDCKVDVEYEYDKYLPHAANLFVNVIPEARDRLIIIIQWMKKQLKQLNDK